MKKIFLTGSLLFLSNLALHAQVKIGANPQQIIPSALLQINGTDQSVDNYDPNTLIFYGPYLEDPKDSKTDKGARLGVGTTKPKYTIDAVSDSPDGTGIALRNFFEGGHQWYLNSESGSSISPGAFHIWDKTENFNKSRFQITSQGNVGIGDFSSNLTTNQPISNLDIYNDGTNSTRAQIAIRAHGGRDYFLSSQGTDTSGQMPDGGIKDSFVIWDGTENESRLFIASNGNVALGANNYFPGANLDIVNTNPLSPRAQIGLRTLNGGHQYYISSEGTGPDQGTPGALVFWDATANASRLFISENGNIGIGANNYNPATLLDVSGNITANAIQGPSDIRFKKNIKPLENSLAKITSLKGYNYQWKKDEFPNKNFKSGTDIGLIAQEVEKIYPEVVYTADDEMKSKSIDYSKLVPALVEAIKELQKEVEELKSQMPYQKR